MTAPLSDTKLSADEPLFLSDPVTVLPGIAEKRAALLKTLGIHTLEDLLFHLPRDYQDRSKIHNIADVKVGDKVNLCGEIVAARSLSLRGGKNMALLEVDDGTGRIKISLFGRGFLVRRA